MSVVELLRGRRDACRQYLPDVLRAVELRLDAAGESGLAGVAAEMGVAAQDHARRCRACRAEATETALVLIRIQRWARDSTRVDSPAEMWPRLRARIEASQLRGREAAWRARASVIGLITSTLLVGIVVGPLTMSGTAAGWAAPQEPSGLSSRDRFVGQIELRYVQQAQRGVVRPSATVEIGATSGQRLLPDGIRTAPKEVSPTQSTGRTRDVS